MAVVSSEDINNRDEREHALTRLREFISPFPPNAGKKRTIVNSLLTLGLYGFLVWIIYLLYEEYHADRVHPSTSVTYDYPPPQIGLSFPSIVVCNYAGFVPLKLKSCTWTTFTYTANQPPKEVDCTSTALGLEIFDLNFNFSRSCVAINTYNDSFYALSPDMQNSITFSVDVNIQQYPLNSSIAAIVTVFVDPEPDLALNMGMFYASRYFAGVGTYTIFSVLKSQSKMLRDSQYKTAYDVTTNSVPLWNKAGDGVVNVSVSYEELYTQVITQEYSYDLTKFFADVASYAGTIVDLNLFKVIIIGQVYPFVLYHYFKLRNSRKIFTHVELSQRVSPSSLS